MEKKQADEFLKTLIGAYVWVASADERVDKAELTKYEHVMVQSQFATQFDVDDVRRYFKDTVALFADHFEAAVDLTKSRLKEIKSQAHMAEEVIRISRAAVVGDGRIAEPEEGALTEIAGILGIQTSI